MYWVAPLTEAVKVALLVQVTVPVVVSLELTSPTVRLEQPGISESPVAVRWTNDTLAFRISPAFVSYAGSLVTAVISRTLADKVTVADVLVADEVQKSVFPL